MNSMETWVRTLLVATLLTAASLVTGCQTAPVGASAPPTKALQAAMTPAQALERLKEGNQRFVTGRTWTRDIGAERQATAAGQYPFAVVLSCLDSRCSSELVFDQGLGDIFSARVAGNIMDEDILGSMEFACKASGAKLIVVVGHSKCGAVKGACSGVELGHLTSLLAKIRPAVEAVPIQDPGGRTSEAHVNAVAKENVKLVVEQIRGLSPILEEMIQSGEIGLIGAMHDLDSGRVTFLN